MLAPKVARLSIIWLAVLLPIIFSPAGFNIYAPVRSWLLYTATTVITALFIYYLVFSSHTQWRRQKLVENSLAVFSAALLISTFLSVHLYSSLYGNFSRYEGIFAWACYLILFVIAYQLFIEKKDIERFLAGIDR